MGLWREHAGNITVTLANDDGRALARICQPAVR
jgi:hypothetical protein